MTSFPYDHGRNHRPGGSDPAIPGVAHLIGTVGEPAFENGWANVGGSSELMQFLIVIGRPNWMDMDGVTILQYQPKVIEIIGDVDGGASGTTVFTLPPAYRNPRDRPYDGHDNAGLHVPCRLYSDGRFVRGTP